MPDNIERQDSMILALVQAEEQTHYVRTETVHLLRLRLIQIRHILNQVLDWYEPDNPAAARPNQDILDVGE